ncbi:MAG: hypothetical protein NZZ41_03020 [Candidatus Dojkabacteria bacterium]|nr:hypothetical protein [Candidatus Dojkabacteria bacterium]
MDPDSSSTKINFDYFSEKRIFEILNKMTSIAENLQGAGNKGGGCGCRVLSAIFVNKRFLNYGYNSLKSNPFQVKYGKNEQSIYFHAETNAIKRAIDIIGYDNFIRSKITLFIVRVKKTPNSPNFIWGLSKPCKGCLRAIIDMKVDNVIYSLDQDFSNKKDYNIMVNMNNF